MSNEIKIFGLNDLKINMDWFLFNRHIFGNFLIISFYHAFVYICYFNASWNKWLQHLNDFFYIPSVILSGGFSLKFFIFFLSFIISSRPASSNFHFHYLPFISFLSFIFFLLIFNLLLFFFSDISVSHFRIFIFLNFFHFD